MEAAWEDEMRITCPSSRSESSGDSSVRSGGEGCRESANDWPLCHRLGGNIASGIR